MHTPHEQDEPDRAQGAHGDQRRHASHAERHGGLQAGQRAERAARPWRQAVYQA